MLVLAPAALIAGSGSAYAAHLQKPTNARDAQGYASAYKALMIEWRAEMAALSSRPLPPSSLPKPEHRAKLAEAIDDVAHATEGFAHKMDTLKPPPAFREVHIATRAFFKIFADGNRHLATAIRSGKKADVAKAITRSDQAEATAMKHMTDVLQKAANAEGVGGDVKDMLDANALGR